MNPKVASILWLTQIPFAWSANANVKHELDVNPTSEGLTKQKKYWGIEHLLKTKTIKHGSAIANVGHELDVVPTPEGLMEQENLLTLISIKCVNRNDDFDQDEIEILKGGQHFWPLGKNYVHINTGETENIGLTVLLDKPITFTLKEHDYWTSHDTMYVSFDPSEAK